MKKSLKLTRSRKGRKRTEEVSSSDKDSDSSRDELLQNAEKPKKCNQSVQPKQTKKRKFEPEKASVPSPPATKKRKKRNLTRSDSDLSNDNQSGSNSSQDAPANSSSVPSSSANSNDTTQSSEFAQYLKVKNP